MRLFTRRRPARDRLPLTPVPAADPVKPGSSPNADSRMPYAAAAAALAVLCDTEPPSAVAGLAKPLPTIPATAAPAVSPSETLITDWTADLEEAPTARTAEDVPPAVVRHGTLRFEPGTYQVTYDRGAYRTADDRFGHRGTPAPDPLTTTADTITELSGAIASHARPHIGEGHLDVVTDLAVMGGQISVGARTVGTFTLRSVEDRPPWLLFPYNLPPLDSLTPEQMTGKACVYCPETGFTTPPPGEVAYRFVGRIRGEVLVGHRECAAEHRIG